MDANGSKRREKSGRRLDAITLLAKRKSEKLLMESDRLVSLNSKSIGFAQTGATAKRRTIRASESSTPRRKSGYALAALAAFIVPTLV
jgi:hypothetical protein